MNGYFSLFLPIKIFAYQHFRLSLFSSVWCICYTQIRLAISFYFLADIWQVFLQTFSKKSPVKQKLITKSLPKTLQETVKPFSKSLPKARKSQKARIAPTLIILSLSADICIVFCHWYPENSRFHFWLLVDVFLLLEHFWLLADFKKMILLLFIWFSALGRLLVISFCSSELKFLEKLRRKIAKNHPESRKEIGSLICVLLI